MMCNNFSCNLLIKLFIVLCFLSCILMKFTTCSLQHAVYNMQFTIIYYFIHLFVSFYPPPYPIVFSTTLFVSSSVFIFSYHLSISHPSLFLLVSLFSPFSPFTPFFFLLFFFFLFFFFYLAERGPTRVSIQECSLSSTGKVSQKNILHIK